MCCSLLVSNLRKCIEFNGEALQLHRVYKKLHISPRASYVRIRVSTSYARTCVLLKNKLGETDYFCAIERS